ncbi:MAG TPA: phosphate ABC transporter permease PstA [Tepidiformaceae bacterium]|nr:phosphate ABC transporter permease PstA [Tepidiformaceae bacterium]HNO66013.1 phosphate ABC transporter permease PstA [Tepidiformaceae bacterium]
MSAVPRSPVLTRTEGLYRRRKLVDQAMTAAMIVAALLAVIPLFLILFYLLREGIPGLSWELLTEEPTRPGREGGGVFNSIVGSVIMVGAALAIGVPVAIGCGIFLSEFGQNKAGGFIRFIIEVMAGIPSITVGLFVYSLVVVRQGRFSGIAGSIALAIILVPIVARITEEMMLLVPRSIREASYALGAPRWRTVLRIVFPTALPGIITGIMLALSRICGEAAPLLFTALGNQFTTADITAPMDSLPRRIYVYATGPYDYWHEQAWAMSLILVSVILVISLVIRTLFGARVVVRQ